MAKRIPWVLLSVAGVLIVALWLRIDRLQDEMADLRTEIRAANSVSDAPSGQPSAAADVDSAESPRIENDLDDERREAAVEVAESPAEPEPEEIVQAAEGVAVAMGGLDETMIREEAAKLAAAQYAGLYRILALDADTERVVREIIADGLSRAMLNQSELNDNADTIGERNRLVAEAVAEIDAELQSILTADELDAWREYDANFEQRQLENGFLAMMARASTDLPGASRDTVAVVLAEEWFAAADTFADELFNDTNNADMMVHATEMALDRLYELLDENEFAYAEEFIQIFVEQLESQRPENSEKSKSLA